MNGQGRPQYSIAPAVLAVAAVLGSLLAHAALLTGALSIYSALSTVPSTASSLSLIFGLPIGVSLAVLAGFIKYVQASALWHVAVLALLATCAVIQVVATPFWSCLVSRAFCL